jgi:hypothetical protein
VTGERGPDAAAGAASDSAADAPRALLLDLDRAVIREHGVSDVARNRMLERLHRSRRKLESRAGVRTTEAELMSFEEGLRGG